MQVKMLKKTDIDVESFAQFTFHARQNSDLQSDERTLEGLRTLFQHAKKTWDTTIMVAAFEGGSNDLVGWMALELGLVPNMAVVQPWQPIIRPEKDKEAIAKALIEESKEYVAKHPPLRLETWLPLFKGGLEKAFDTYSSWYESAKFEKLAEEYRMQSNLTEWAIQDRKLPPEVKIVLLEQVQNEALHEVVFATFLQSNDQWFLKQNQVHQEGAIALWFNREEAFDREASLVLQKDGNYIGFIVVRIENDLPDLGPIGIHPDYRGKYLGKTLVSLSLDKLKSKGYETAILEVSVQNTTAINLYEKLGFEKQYRIFLYGWAPQ
jgi:mycothiol synthase